MVEITRDVLRSLTKEDILLPKPFETFSYTFIIAESTYARKELVIQWNDYTKDKKSKWYVWFLERDLKNFEKSNIVCLRNDLVYLEDLQLIYKGITNKDL